MRDAGEWNARYESNALPWDVGRPDRNLTAMISAHAVRPGRVLELGCGTGSDSLWLAAAGFAVTAVDIAPRAIERARAKAAEARAAVEHRLADVLNDPIPGAPYDLVYDRGCFHTCSDAESRVRFVERVSDWLKPSGHWISLIGNADGPRLEVGPPRWSALEITTVVEPRFEILELRAGFFEADSPVSAWVCVMRKRVEGSAAG